MTSMVTEGRPTSFIEEMERPAGGDCGLILHRRLRRSDSDSDARTDGFSKSPGCKRSTKPATKVADRENKCE